MRCGGVERPFPSPRRICGEIVLVPSGTSRPSKGAATRTDPSLRSRQADSARPLAARAPSRGSLTELLPGKFLIPAVVRDQPASRSLIEEPLDLSAEVFDLERLHEAEVRAAAIGAIDVPLLRVPRDRHDLDGLRIRIRLDALADLDAVHVGHHDVENDQVGTEDPDLQTGLVSVARGAHLERLGVAERLADDVHDRRLVVDDEDALLLLREKVRVDRHAVASEEILEVALADSVVT